MQTLASTINCPVCTQPATITLYGDLDEATGTDSRTLEFSCLGRCAVAEGELILLWADSLR